jgi:hypothetical protein
VLIWDRVWGLGSRISHETGLGRGGSLICCIVIGHGGSLGVARKRHAETMPYKVTETRRGAFRLVQT